MKRSQARVSLLVWGLFICALVFLASLLAAFALPKEPRYILSISTAEYLEEYPRQAPPFILVDIDCVNAAPHCFRILPEIIVRNANGVREMQHRIRTLIVRIDGEVQLDFALEMHGAQVYGEIPIERLGSGLHLIEVQIQDKDKRIYQHAWTIRLGNGIAAPPTLALPPTLATATP